MQVVLDYDSEPYFVVPPGFLYNIGYDSFDELEFEIVNDQGDSFEISVDSDADWLEVEIY
mgnify:CR=1 FL=1